MDKQTKDFVRTTIDLPPILNKKIIAEAEKEMRSRHSQMIYALERYFETTTAKQTERKPHLIMPKAAKEKIK